VSQKVAIIGGGFTGLSAAYYLSQIGVEVTIFERDARLGGLAGSFEIAPGKWLEKFYHHWFTSDVDALELVSELGLDAQLHSRATSTGLFFANSIFRLSSPWDLLKFTPISFFSRIRVGVMALRARMISDYLPLESISAEEWILKMAGREAFEVVWKPLLHGKFGDEAPNVSAVWFWNKLKLRGSSRGKSAEERLYYLSGGFEMLLTRLKEKLTECGCQVRTSAPVKALLKTDTGIRVDDELFDSVLVTTPIPSFNEMAPELPDSYRERLSQIRYLGNVCLVLGLSRSLSSTYWLNVTDPEFPFVGVIEHTNFEPVSSYNGMHVVYLSKYLPTSDQLYSMSKEEMIEFALPHLKKMFPEFQREWIIASYLWKESYSQPVITKDYSKLIPKVQTPIPGLFLSTMAQVYPEDRGTSYAIRGGKQAAREVARYLMQG
jgi:protoporphyrinogen oxidase